MKKLILLIAVLLAISACKKESVTIDKRSGSSNSNTNTDGVYTWPGFCIPANLTFIGSTPVTENGISEWIYTFSISLNTSQVNPVGKVLYIPHVGPSGTTIYDNVANDATYTIVSVVNGLLTFSVKTADVTSAGCKLKFNLSVDRDANARFFLAHGSYVQNPTLNHNTDDYINNIFCIIFKSGSIYPGIN